MLSKEKKNLLVFGFGLTLILAVLAWRYSQSANPMTFVFLALSVLLGCITALAPQRLTELYQAWMKVAHFIGTVFSTLLLTVVFYVMFAAVGIVMRLRGKDLLEEKQDPTRPSYWIPLAAKPFRSDDYKRQF